jgi:transcriptional regulator with XRE-family HTH domain
MFDYAPTAQRFAKARERLGLTHYQLAKLTGLPFSTVVRLEQEDAKPTLDTIARAAAALGARAVLKLEQL